MSGHLILGHEILAKTIVSKSKSATVSKIRAENRNQRPAVQ